MYKQQKITLSNDTDIREHTVFVPSMLRNRSTVPWSTFKDRLVFQGERYQTHSSPVCLLIDSRSAWLREDQQPGNVKSVTVNQFKSSGPDFIKTMLRASKGKRDEVHLKGGNKYFY